VVPGLILAAKNGPPVANSGPSRTKFSYQNWSGGLFLAGKPKLVCRTCLGYHEWSYFPIGTCK